MKRRLDRLAFWVVAVAATLTLYGAGLWLGDLNQDEGWYLYAARLVGEGRLPYVDFASTQGPVMPFVYVLAGPLVRGWGIAGGRLFTALLGLASAAGAAVLAYRLTGRTAGGHRAAAVTFALVGVNVYQAYFTTVVKTYALTALIVVLGFLALTLETPRRRAWPAWLAGVLFALAAATRLSAAAVIPGVLVWGLIARRREQPPLPIAAFLLGVGVALVAVFGPFLRHAPGGVWFALFEYHAGRDPGGLVPMLAYKAGFVARMVLAYTAAAVVLLLLLCASLARPRRSGFASVREWGSSPSAPLWLSVAAVTGLHVAAPFPYDDYQTVIYPLVCAALGIGVAGVFGPDRPRDGAAGAEDAVAIRIPPFAFILLLTLLTAGSSPLVQGWLVGERDRIWWPLKSETPLANLRYAGALVRTLTGADEPVLTQDTYLAVEAGRRVPAGLELGPFSYFPDWPREKAARLHVMNRDRLRELLASCEAPVAAFSGYGLAIASPEVRELPPAEQAEWWDRVRARYRPWAEIPRFGQAATELKILVLNRDEATR